VTSPSRPTARSKWASAAALSRSWCHRSTRRSGPYPPLAGPRTRAALRASGAWCGRPEYGRLRRARGGCRASSPSSDLCTLCIPPSVRGELRREPKRRRGRIRELRVEPDRGCTWPGLDLSAGAGFSFAGGSCATPFSSSQRRLALPLRLLWRTALTRLVSCGRLCCAEQSRGRREGSEARGVPAALVDARRRAASVAAAYAAGLTLSSVRRRGSGVGGRRRVVRRADCLPHSEE